MTRARTTMTVALALLDRALAGYVGELTAKWSTPEFEALDRLLVAQGLSAWLFEDLGDDGLGRLLSKQAVQRVTGQYRANVERIDALHSDLATILRAAAAAGIEVMPLKGALLTTRDERWRYRRPMADLDLLVRPADLAGMAALLVELGYRHRPEKNPRPTHDTYLNPGADRVVADGEHVDNPRPVELHTEVLRHLWGWIGDDDVTPALWSRAQRDTVCGEPATVPADADLCAHLAAHASSDLLVGRGRVIQWLDFVTLADTLRTSLPALPHPALAYPSLGLAYRALPQLGDVDPLLLNPLVPQRLVNWVQNVAIDDRAGLMMPGRLGLPSSWRARWKRWAPYRWRMAVAYGDVSLPIGLARHFSMLFGHARRAGRA